MKYYLFITLLFITNGGHALDFKRCVDKQGVEHFTNLPLSTLDGDCKQKVDSYNLYLRYDYQRLRQRLSDSTEPVERTQEESVVNKVIEAVKDAVDPDKALESLLQNTQDQRANPASEFFRSRTEAIQQILDN